MSASLIIMIVLVLAAALATALKPGVSFREAIQISKSQAIRVLPIVIPAAFIAGFLAELLPRELVSGLVGPESGILGFALAAVAGAILPTGPMVVLPLGAALLQADAGFAQILTLYASWTLVNVQRFIIWEVPLVGMSMAARRLAGGFIALPFAILGAELIELILAR
ncbi:MAG: permease [Rhodospirillales bacterium]|jgi:uncharacterized membrane protein YraQ (UPF0718 family)